MNVLGINSIVCEDTVLYYRRNYTAVASIEFLSKQEDIAISFTIEINPFGQKFVHITYPLGTTFDYPVIPVTKALREKIILMDNEGKLPL
ncbi:hypothetical protein [Treponema pectinovorum]|uniref:hypothetical protein n=1 Tax=Treponema pectinovorum TaxID=164 RepID=UPI0011CB021F|nr:hypothetical protein [Treponema pectinovorum]